MKIRIGICVASASSNARTLGEIVTGIDELGFDSLWLSEVLTGPVIDPAIGLAWAAARNPRLKGATAAAAPGPRCAGVGQAAAQPRRALQRPPAGDAGARAHLRAGARRD